jgi:signal transduction histidine kinase
MALVVVGPEAGENSHPPARPVGREILELLLQRKESVRFDMLGEGTEVGDFPAQFAPLQSFLSVPVLQAGTTLGSLYLTEKEGDSAFTLEDQEAVEALGPYSAVAIQNLHSLIRQHALVSGLINAQEEERKAVAYDLHDGLTQYVMASHAHLESFLRAREIGNEERSAQALEYGLRYLKEAVVESRRLVNGLRALALEDLGLAGAVEQLLEEEKARTGWQEAILRHNIAERRFDDTLQTAIYRVAQEALTNARKHAQTSKIAISLISSIEAVTGSEQLILEVQDWGQGFALEEKLREHERVGLHSMRERILLLGGTFNLQSRPGEGTYLRAVLPAPEASP